MSTLNFHSFPPNYNTYDSERAVIETETRVFGQKGLFIVPYDTNRIVMFVKMDFRVIYIQQEYQSLWTNPELGFYGYVHARQNKTPIGSPVPLHHRYQQVFYWNPPEPYQQLEIIGTLINLGQFLGSPFQFGRLFFAGPTVTDFSFGFKVDGRYTATITIGYWNEGTWESLGVPRPEQDVPNPEAVEAIDPNPGKQNGDPNTPIDQPYNPENNDFGENVPGTAEPPDDFPPAPFYIRWFSDLPGLGPSENLSLYSGSEIVSLAQSPSEGVQFPGSYVLAGVNADGPFEVVLRSVSEFQSFNEAFLNTFEIRGYEPFE